MIILNKNCPISEAQINTYNSFITNVKEQIDRSYITSLHCVLLQTANQLNDNREFFNINKKNKFTVILLSKTLSEGWGIIACNDWAVGIVQHHHIRSALELIAIYYWVFNNSKKTDKRIKRYFEYENLLKYQLHCKKVHKCTQEEIDNYESKLNDWISLYEPEDDDLLKIKSWYEGAYINNIISEFPNQKIKGFYDEFSHAVHFSPYTKYLGPDSVLGVEGDMKLFNRPIIIYLETLNVLLGWVNHFIGSNFNVRFPKMLG